MGITRLIHGIIRTAIVIGECSTSTRVLLRLAVEHSKIVSAQIRYKRTGGQRRNHDRGGA
jgi:hypothetical protein